MLKKKLAKKLFEYQHWTKFNINYFVKHCIMCETKGKFVLIFVILNCYLYICAVCNVKIELVKCMFFSKINIYYVVLCSTM